MHRSTEVFPRTLVQITGQDLVSYAGVKPLLSFVDALGIKRLGEEHLGQAAWIDGSGRGGRRQRRDGIVLRSTTEERPG